MTKRTTIKRHGPKIADTSDKDQVAAAEKHEQGVTLDIGFVMSQPRGRRWLHSLIYDKCHVGRLSHVPRDTHSTAFNEGARSVGEALLEELRSAHHALYITMLEENDHAE